MKHVFLILFFTVLGLTGAEAAPKAKKPAVPSAAETEKKKKRSRFSGGGKPAVSPKSQSRPARIDPFM